VFALVSRPTIAVIGGGFSGAAVAFHLAKAGVRADILVFEPRERLGGGLAYGGDDPVHRVNVPATRMSLLPEDGDHFARWLERAGILADDPVALAGNETYPRRREFGRYVRETLSPYLATGAIRHIRKPVASLQRTAGGWLARTAEGEEFRADLAVIATTHPAPSLPPQLAAFRGHPQLVADPLVDRVVKGVGPQERVLIVGAGLTAADLVAALDAQAHRGPITLISRHGLRARGRALTTFPPEGEFHHPPARGATALLTRVRAAVKQAEAAARSWQGVIEGVRNQGQDVWRALDPDARRRIVRHLRPFWDAHRFRAAPQIEAILDRKLKDGALEMKRARLGAVRPEGSGFSVELRDLRAGTSQTRSFDRILVAIGPAHRDILRSQSFLAELAQAGALKLDATELGLWTSREGQAIGANGLADPTLFIAGPLARGTFGELMGLPQVSEYAQFVAAQVATKLERLVTERNRRQFDETRVPIPFPRIGRQKTLL
jgi:uncharacterized NAD(P)/FAD-binding protein YdhS